MEECRTAKNAHHRKLQPKARGYHVAPGIPVGDPAGKRSEKHEGRNEQQGDHADQPACPAGGKQPLNQADKNEFGCIVVKGDLRLGEEEAAESVTSKEVFHRRQESSSFEIYIIDKS
jgi:hypothetical protein